MWPFRSKKKKDHIAKQVIAGLIIGGAIGSIIGKKLMDEKQGKEEEDEDDEKDENGFSKKKV